MSDGRCGDYQYQNRGQSIWGIPLLFLLGMAAGYGLGLQQVTLPYTEGGILLSVVGLGLLPAWPRPASVWWFSLGFLDSSTGLHLVG
ncbi:MAG: HupE/UreJ family protein [Anaerolineae bacterium]|nr:HupE/UreJ family protein [Anaerolineae bacterium]